MEHRSSSAATHIYDVEEAELCVSRAHHAQRAVKEYSVEYTAQHFSDLEKLQLQALWEVVYHHVAHHRPHTAPRENGEGWQGRAVRDLRVTAGTY